MPRCALVLFFSYFLADSLFAQLVGGVWESPYHFQHLSGGSHLAVGADLTGDGVGDILLNGLSMSPGATLYDGATGAYVRRMSGPGAEGDLAFLDDLDQDGVPDYAFGFDQYSVHVCSGADGQLLRVLWNPTPEGAPYGAELTRVGDVDGDGFDDLVVASGPSAGPGVELFSVGTGNLVHTFPLDGYAAPYALGDIDGDGSTDLLIATFPAGFHLYSGTTHQLIRHHTGYSYTTKVSVVDCDDLDGDGIEDYAIRTSYDRIEAHSGATGSFLWGTDSALAPFALTRVGDWDQDGVEDLVSSGNTQFPSLNGAIVAISGADGSQIRRVRGLPFSQHLGHLLATLDDLDGDGLVELLASSVVGDMRFQAISFHPVLFADRSSVSGSQGGAVQFDIHFPTGAGGLDYLLLASEGGVGPITSNGVEIPLFPDALFWSIHGGSPPPHLTGSSGVLSATGRASARFELPSGSTAALGRIFSFAAVASWRGAVRASSIACSVEIAP